ncbi:hypothetical protein SteCoe_29444 [Stentor coeruleus]|uniref:Uncharacterized protein n=1 Tax=Stentor coeruleus TaxID=5963 RepID=A0A1R2B5Z4_9CILI|nr:hypothetical protein SteCoe_29444 [Stentor coeruleus]
MEFIFEHDKLRMDEITRRINAKNNFTPLKPLRSTKFFTQQGKTNSQTKGNKHIQNKSCSKKSKTFIDTQSISHKLPNTFDNSSNRLFKETFSQKFSKQKILASAFPALDISVRFINKEKTKNKVFPEVRKSVNSIERKTRDLKNDSRINSQSLIAYIPSVAYVNEKDDMVEKGDKLNDSMPKIHIPSFKPAKKHV